jgi:hypothetical protein
MLQSRLKNHNTSQLKPFFCVQVWGGGSGISMLLYISPLGILIYGRLRSRPYLPRITKEIFSFIVCSSFLHWELSSYFVFVEPLNLAQEPSRYPIMRSSLLLSYEYLVRQGVKSELYDADRSYLLSQTC